jgi:hypothetical protein
MPDFTKSKIYKLVNTENDEIYIGSTCAPLRKRKCGHKANAKRFPNRRVYQHLNAVGWDNVRIVLLQSISCINKDELIAAEQHWIDLLRPSLNKVAAVYSDCPHGRKQSMCKDCNGVGICEHGRDRYQCKPCGGSKICEHDRQRSSCKPCGGSSICEHGRHRSSCKPCGGSSICEHGRHRSSCKPCGGSSICEHDRVRRMCIECSPFHCDYCNTTHAKGTILQHYKSDKHRQAYVAAYIETHDEQPTEFPFNQLVH